jgi:hypothetical protein
VREAALVLPLGAVLARPQATVVAVVSRLLVVVGDLGWSAIAVVARRRRRSGGVSPLAQARRQQPDGQADQDDHPARAAKSRSAPT